MSDSANDRPFVLMATLLIAHQHGDYEKALESQRRLANLGWYVSRKLPEQPEPTRRKKSKATA